jgi:hypothetical protein
MKLATRGEYHRLHPTCTTNMGYLTLQPTANKAEPKAIRAGLMSEWAASSPTDTPTTATNPMRAGMARMGKVNAPYGWR